MTSNNQTAPAAAKNSVSSFALVINDLMGLTEKMEGKESTLIHALWSNEATFSYIALCKILKAEGADRTKAIEDAVLVDVPRYQAIVAIRNLDPKTIGSPEKRVQHKEDLAEAQREGLAILQLCRRALKAVLFLRQPKNKVESVSLVKGKFIIATDAGQGASGKTLIKETKMSRAELVRLGDTAEREMNAKPPKKPVANPGTSAPINTAATAAAAIQGAAQVFAANDIAEKKPEEIKAFASPLASIVLNMVGAAKGSKTITLDDAEEFFKMIGLNFVQKKTEAKPAEKKVA
jgi:hypothetical protein